VTGEGIGRIGTGGRVAQGVEPGMVQQGGEQQGVGPGARVGPAAGVGLDARAGLGGDAGLAATPAGGTLPVAVATPARGAAPLGLWREALREGRFSAVIAAAEALSRTRPLSVPERQILGHALIGAGRFLEGVEALFAAARAAPHDPEGWYWLGLALAEGGAPHIARTALLEALRLAPHFLEAEIALAGVALDLGEIAEAGDRLARLQQRAPARPELLVLLGNHAHVRGAFAEAEAHYAAALTALPGNPILLYNAGSNLRALGRLEESRRLLEAAHRARPELPMIELGLAHTLLALGDWAAGWAHYESRLRLPLWRWPAPFGLPLWQGEPLAGGLLVFAEQGQGDVLQFARLIPRLKGRAGAVWFLVPRSLERLMRASLPGWVRILGEGGGGSGGGGSGGAGPPEGVVAAVPLLSLPQRLGLRLADLPGPIPYLRADPALVARWGARLGPRREGVLRGGLVWAGEARPEVPHYREVDRRRSMKLADFAPLGEILGIEWFSLQMGPPRAELAHPPKGLAIRDAMEGVADFADTAALLAHLDFLVSVDTAPAHLAGALGKPVFLLSRFDGCWRWLNNQRESPFYPTLRLYAQPRVGDWSTPLAALAADLARLAAQPAPPLRRASPLSPSGAR
jgi:tetratricopeptide (TPR) repeat protein